MIIRSVFVDSLAGPSYLSTSQRANGQLSDSQALFAQLAAVAISLALVLAIAVTMALYGRRVNGRVHEMAAADPDGILLNTYRRWDPGFQAALRELGVENTGRYGVFVVLAGSAGVGIYADYRPPTRLLFIPWTDVHTVDRGEFEVGIRGIARIELTVQVAGGSDVTLPIVPSQTGWAIYNFSSAQRTKSLIARLSRLKSGERV